ncbi:Clan CA, family C1, cathepsin L-like cysteine peptidase [Histomonas meleagridis]|uniref:Clan CA, family C1, cathepsin L-like cysteine peptidase n=1 Tax=Histomonas meleagridis TaxID=135588 RepID=UPI00355A77E8|nr:Clan CA, family C1, cathepsin L-like cysteine peptidase [Histomonas meleagridis]KAH0805361.1 Clan CA, family C1, cathepsin L-like cysteine peptidase [Histomonas meleagridis]
MFSAFLALTLCDPVIPQWPPKYRIRGTWSIPYQKIREPVEIHVDTFNTPARQSEIKYGGAQRIVHILGNRSYTIQETPFDKVSCLFSEIQDPASDEMHQYLPDPKDEGWVYEGVHVLLGKKCHTWKKSNIENVANWYYMFYLDVDSNLPVRFFQHGLSIRHSHPTDYIFDVEDFGPITDESAFLLPTTCHNIESGGPSHHNPRKFARDISLPPRSNSLSPYCTLLPKLSGTVPSEFSWRNVPGVVDLPRDQATCGSCWAQAAANAISSQLALRGLSNHTISVAQINDCTWGHNNYGCEGGNTDEAYAFLSANKTILVPEDEYPYLGIVGKCQKVTKDSYNTKIGYVKGCYQVPQFDDEQLKLAVYQKGPLSVYILASLPTFTAYQGGDKPYFDEKCTAQAETDHVVLLTGWKKFGDDWAWEIQNSWSDFWGDNGYGYIQHGDYDCGLTQSAFLPIVELYDENE